MCTQLIRTPYTDGFNPKEYLNLLYTPDPAFRVTFEFQRQQLYNFYTKYSCKWNNKSARLLEFGGGAVIAHLISAVPYVDQITFAAYLEDERKEVELWKHGKEGAHDWSPYFRYAVNEMEHIAGDDAWRERQELLRNRVTNIIPCDIFSDNPLLVKQESAFEIVSTSLCLEAACTTHAQYKEGVKKLVGLLEPGGFLLIFGDEQGTFYTIGNKKYPCLYLTLEQVKEILAEAGLVVVMAERDPAPMEILQIPIESDYKASMFLAAQKLVSVNK